MLESEGQPGKKGRPRLLQLQSMGYLVPTVPPEDRDRLRTKAALSHAGKVLARVVRTAGAPFGVWQRGLRRWHFFGDQEGDQVPEYHPHLNMLLEGGWVPLCLLQVVLPAMLRDELQLSRLPDLQYHYYDKPGQKFHKLKYVARATFLKAEWDEDLAADLHGFRNMSWWGKWDGQAVWSVAEGCVDEEGQLQASPGELAMLGKLEKGACPICGQAITWSGVVVPMSRLPSTAIRLPGGYWALPPPDH